MEYIDRIYIIIKKEYVIDKEGCIAQLMRAGLINYKFVDAIYPSESFYLKTVYNEICKSMERDFVIHNFPIGALGCLLSHIQVIKDAMNNNFRRIMILEGDFIMSNTFASEFPLKLSSLDNKWDLVYLGKKQGNFDKFHVVKEIHTCSSLFQPAKKFNLYFSRPNYQTWGTHAILLNHSVFETIINFEKNIVAPIDIMLMSLYEKYKCFVAEEDLIIANEESSDIKSKANVWNWDVTKYVTFTRYQIKRVVVLDFKKSDHHTHHYIHKMYVEFFIHYYPNLNVVWAETIGEVEESVPPENTVIFISPCHASKEYELPKNAFYIIHLDAPDNNYITDTQLNTFFDNYEHIRKSQRYIIITCRKGLYDLSYFESCKRNRAICLPWFAANLYRNVYDINKELTLHYEKNVTKSYFCYFGSIWDLNIDVILRLIEVFAKNGEQFLLKGRIFNLDTKTSKYIREIQKTYSNIHFEKFNYDITNHISNTFEYIDERYGIKALLPLQGNSHDEKYLSNRIFETVSKGYLAVTNCKLVKDNFKTVLYNDNIELLITQYIEIINNKNKWLELMGKQIEEYLWKFYGYLNIKTLFTFLHDNCQKHCELPYFDRIDKAHYTLWIRHCKQTARNRYFKQINNDDELRYSILKCDKNYILNWDKNVLDIFLVDRLISNKQFTVYVDNNHELLSCEYLQKVLKDKPYQLKEPVEVFCLISGQRTGSTVLIDILQKYAPNVLALSEIFNDYKDSFDMQKGILKNKINEFIEFNGDNTNEFLTQFIDYAEYKNFNKFVFKWTLDYTKDIHSLSYFNTIASVVNKLKNIYLTRNDMMCYVSKKMAEIYGYANIEYTALLPKTFNLKELNQVINNRIEYEKLLFVACKIFKTICYVENCSNSDLIRMCEESFGLTIDQDTINCKKYHQINCKQNKFHIDEILHTNNWS